MGLWVWALGVSEEMAGNGRKIGPFLTRLLYLQIEVNLFESMQLRDVL